MLHPRLAEVLNLPQPEGFSRVQGAAKGRRGQVSRIKRIP